MNDTELDELLDGWEAPPMRESVREELRAGFARSAGRPERFALGRTIFGRMAVATACAAVLLFAIVQVAPRTIRLASSGYHIPFYVESVFERFARDGSVEYRSLRTSFPYAGIPYNMSVIEAHKSWLDPLRRIGFSIRTQIVLAMPSLVIPKQPPMQEPAWFAGYVRSGCSERATVIGHETIAGHETTVIQTGAPGNRVKAWLAPDLECFALKMTFEVLAPDGTYQLQTRSEALEVVMNP
jgi:hypothetical protein